MGRCTECGEYISFFGADDVCAQCLSLLIVNITEETKNKCPGCGEKGDGKFCKKCIKKMSSIVEKETGGSYNPVSKRQGFKCPICFKSNADGSICTVCKKKYGLEE